MVFVGPQTLHGLCIAIGPSNLNADGLGSWFVTEAKDYAVVVGGENARPARYPSHQLASTKLNHQFGPDGIAVAAGSHQLKTDPGILLSCVVT